MMSAKTGLLLVGHGTRSEIGAQQFLALAERLRERVQGIAVVEAAFLELRQPDIEGAVDRLVDQGIERLVTMPMLLFAAGHAKEDVPAAVAAALARSGQSDIGQVQAGHLGCHPAVVELSRLRMEEAVSKVQGPRSNVQGSEECLLLVGRGSRDDSATAEMHDFARLLQKAFASSGLLAAEPLACASGLCDEKVEVAFLAMARPLLAEQLALIARQDYKRVIVQPHLLFHGELVESLQRQVRQTEAAFPETEWLVTQPLADWPGFVTPATNLIEKVILERCQEVGIHVVGMLGDD